MRSFGLTPYLRPTLDCLGEKDVTIGVRMQWDSDEWFQSATLTVDAPRLSRRPGSSSLCHTVKEEAPRRSPATQVHEEKEPQRMIDLTDVNLDFPCPYRRHKFRKTLGWAESHTIVIFPVCGRNIHLNTCELLAGLLVLPSLRSRAISSRSVSDNSTIWIRVSNEFTQADVNRVALGS